MRFVLGLVVLKLVLSVTFFLNSGMEGPPGMATAASSNRNSEETGTNSDNVVPSDQAPCQPEVLEILRTRFRELDKRQAELEKEAQDLELLRKDIEKRLKELKDLQAKLEGPAKKARDANKAQFQHLVGVYSSMEPNRAAALLDKMEETTVVRIFAAMKSRKVAKILALMDPDKAASISSELSKNKLPGNSNS